MPEDTKEFLNRIWSAIQNAISLQDASTVAAFRNATDAQLEKIEQFDASKVRRVTAGLILQERYMRERTDWSPEK